MPIGVGDFAVKCWKKGISAPSAVRTQEFKNRGAIPPTAGTRRPEVANARQRCAGARRRSPNSAVNPQKDAQPEPQLSNKTLADREIQENADNREQQRGDETSINLWLIGIHLCDGVRAICVSQIVVLIPNELRRPERCGGHRNV